MTLYMDIYIQIIFFYIFLCKEDVKRNILYAINLNQSDDIQNQNVNDDLTLNLIFFYEKLEVQTISEKV